MKVRVLYFAAVRELVGKDEETLDVRPGVATVRALSDELERMHEPLRGRLVAVRFARNEAFASLDDAIEDGDEIALIPPVAGG